METLGEWLAAARETWEIWVPIAISAGALWVSYLSHRESKAARRAAGPDVTLRASPWLLKQTPYSGRIWVLVQLANNGGAEITVHDDFELWLNGVRTISLTWRHELPNKPSEEKLPHRLAAHDTQEWILQGDISVRELAEAIEARTDRMQAWAVTGVVGGAAMRIWGKLRMSTDTAHAWLDQCRRIIDGEDI